MGAPDILIKNMLADPVEFAGLFNYVLYGGEQVIRPDELELVNPQVDLAFMGRKEVKIVSRVRDLLMRRVMMRDEKATYVFLGVENQTHVARDMVLRCLFYDTLTYCMQARASGDSSADFCFSMLKKGEYLSPVHTVVVYYGEEPWDAPLSFRELFDIKDKVICSMLPDYHMTLLTPESIGRNGLFKLGRKLGSVMCFLQARKNKSILYEYIKNGSPFGSIPVEAAMVLKSLININIEIKQGEKEINMYSAFEEIKNDWKMEGITIGKAEGITIGKAEGITIGKAEGANEERKLDIQRTVATLKNNGFPAEKIRKLIMEIYQLAPVEEELYLGRAR